MAALDTNVLVRYLVQDDANQFLAAQQLIEGAIAAGESLYVPITVALELEWVLRSRYSFGKDDVTAAFAALLSATELLFESETALEVALSLFRENKADLSDCVHVALAAQAGHSPLWTFDKAAAALLGARRLE